MNQANLIGYIGRDPEQTQTTRGKDVAKFDLATSERWAGKTHTEWHHIVAFDGLARSCESLGKGDRVRITGRIRNRTWESDGRKYYRTEIYADDIEWLQVKGGRDQEAGEEPEEFQAEDYDDDDYPPF